MKKEYKLNLHSNKIVGTLKCIVLIFAFLCFGFFVNAKEVKAAVTFSESAKKGDDIYDGELGKDFYYGRMDSYTGEQQTRQYKELKLLACSKTSTNNCVKLYTYTVSGGGYTSPLFVGFDPNGNIYTGTVITITDPKVAATIPSSFYETTQYRSGFYIKIEAKYYCSKKNSSCTYGETESHQTLTSVAVPAKFFDDVGPTLYPSSSTTEEKKWTNKQVILPYKDDNGISKIEYCVKKVGDNSACSYTKYTGGTTTFRYTAKESGKYKITVRLQDDFSSKREAKNNSSQYTYEFWIDINKPTFSNATYTSSHSNSGYNKWYEVTVQFADSHSELDSDSIAYCWTTNSKKAEDCIDSDKKLDSEAGRTGTYYLWSSIKDNAGNNSGFIKVGSYNMDNTAPTFVESGLGDTTWKSGNDSVAVRGFASVRFTDANVGVVSSIKYCWKSNKDSSCSPTNSISSNPANIPYPGTVVGYYYLSLQAEDSLGNLSGEIKVKNAYYVDSVDPAYVSHSGTNGVRTHHKVAITYNDLQKDGKAASGVVTLYYCWTDAPLRCTNLNQTETFAGNLVVVIKGGGNINGTYSLWAQAVDAAGNVSNLRGFGSYEFRNGDPTFGLVDFSKVSAKASEVMVVNVMSIVVEENESSKVSAEKQIEVEETEVEGVVSLSNDTTKVNNIREEQKEHLIKEEPHLLHTPSGIQYGVAIGGIYLFGRKRKRINVC